MAESNAPEHQDRGLLGLFGKKKEDETHEQHPIGVDPHGHGHGHVGDVHHAAPPPPVSDVHVEEAHEDLMEEIREGGLMEKLHPIEQHPTGVDPHAHGHVGDVHHAAPHPLVSHVHVEEPKHHGEGETKPHEGGLMGKLHRSDSSSSSSSSDEEGGEKGEKKKKKKEQLPAQKKEGEEHGDKKEGFLEKIKEKLPGHHGKEEEHKSH